MASSAVHPTLRIKPNCKCIAEANRRLKEHNTELVLSLFGGLPSMAASKIDSKVRKGPVRLIPTFCPFCGKKYRSV
jgi:hypothetical protein